MGDDLEFKIWQAMGRYKEAVDKVHALRDELRRAERELMRADVQWSQLVAAHERAESRH
jgi:hypothetical protein